MYRGLIRLVWRTDEAAANQAPSVSLIDLLISFRTEIPRMVWPTLIYVLFSICRTFYTRGTSRQSARLPCWLDFQGPQMWFSRIDCAFLSPPSAALAPLSARRDAPSERLAFHPVFQSQPQARRTEGSHSHPDWGKHAGRCVYASNFWFPQEGAANPPARCRSDERETNAEWVWVMRVAQISVTLSGCLSVIV